MPRLVGSAVVGDGLSVHTDPAALVVGPTGLALGPRGELFVADTADSRIAVIPDALLRQHPVDAGAVSATVSTASVLNGPLGLALAPNGDLITVDGGDNNLVEMTRTGAVVAVRDLDTVDPPVGPCSAWPPPNTLGRSTTSTTTRTPSTHCAEPSRRWPAATGGSSAFPAGTCRPGGLQSRAWNCL